MWERKITFAVTDRELEQGMPRLAKYRIDFTVRYVDSERKESYLITVPFTIKDLSARLIYKGTLDENT